MSTDWSQVDGKLLDPHWYTTGEYHRVFKTLRDEDPVHWAEDSSYGRSYWVLTRHEDVKSYLEDARRYSNRWDSRVPRSPKRRTPEERHEQGWDVNLVTLDPPVHTVYRRPMNKHFSVPAIGRLRPDIEGIVDEIVGDVVDRGECDLVEDIAAELPVRVILRMLGVPEEDWPMLRTASWQYLAPADPRWIIDGDEAKTSLLGLQAVMDYATSLALERRENPKDDFATIIGELEIDGDKLSIHEMRTWLFTMIAAGLETTRNAASVGLWLFLEHPDQRGRLLSDPSLTPSAVEEVLRWSTPTKNRLRIATEDHEFGGKQIRANDWVVGMQASANRDERVFQDPDAFDIARTPNDHLSFSAGPHYCLGRSLARLELGILFNKVLAAFPDMERSTTGEPEWIVDRNVTGFTRMPVRFTSGTQ